MYNNITKTTVSTRYLFNYSGYIECSFLQWLYIQLRMFISTVVIYSTMNVHGYIRFYSGYIFNYEMFVSTVVIYSTMNVHFNSGYIRFYSVYIFNYEMFISTAGG